MIDTKPENAYGPLAQLLGWLDLSDFRRIDLTSPFRHPARARPRRAAAGLRARSSRGRATDGARGGRVRHGLVREGEPDDRFYVLLSGVLAVSQRDLGARSVLRPGDYFGEAAPAMSVRAPRPSPR